MSMTTLLCRSLPILALALGCAAFAQDRRQPGTTTTADGGVIRPNADQPAEMVPPPGQLPTPGARRPGATTTTQPPAASDPASAPRSGNAPGRFFGNQEKFDLDIKSDTVGHLVSYLREKDSSLNVVLSPGVSDIRVGDLKLRSTTAAGVLSALEIATGGTVHAGMRGGDANNSPNMWFVMGASSRPSRQVEVFNLSGYLQRTKDTFANEEKAQAILDDTIIQLEKIVAETTANLREVQSGKGDHPSFKFHRGLNLLVVTGPDDSIEVARKVIGALIGQGQGNNRGNGNPGMMQQGNGPMMMQGGQMGQPGTMMQAPPPPNMPTPPPMPQPQR